MRNLCLLCLCLASTLVVADDVILVGSGGNEEYRERFTDWGNRLHKVLIDHLGRDQKRVHLLLEEADGSRQTSELANFNKLMASLKDQHDPAQNLTIYLIGHGSFLRNIARLHLPGPDLSAAELTGMLKGITAKKVVVINGASAGAPFINQLSGPDRVICSATKSGSEQNATEFMGFFIRALEEDLADRDHDQRISVWEAARQAASMTEKWYQLNGLIATEHAIIDDNGDGLGTRLFLDPSVERPPSPENLDGELAREIFIRDFTFPDSVPKETVARYLSLVEQAKSLKARKKSMDQAEYWRTLEGIMLEAARIHSEIRAEGGG